MFKYKNNSLFFVVEEGERIIAVADGDSFEVQVFQKERNWKKTHGFPTVVADFTSNK